jgi:6-pyruvoyltetrahydropterin/6-carboxytetrahydropterin synthase
MYSVRVEGRFSAAHFLPRYRGKCENLHGHNYLARAWARASSLGEDGMLADFSALREALGKALEPLDHGLLNDVEGLGGNPTAENIARYLFDRLRALLPEVPLTRVDIFETEGSMASWEPDIP